MSTETIYPFSDPDLKYTMVDNYLIDHIMPIIRPNAFKVLILIIRKTMGWHKKEDQISYSQIRELTGISSQSTAQAAIKELIDREIVLQSEGNTKWEAFTYSLNIKFSITVSVLGSSTETVPGSSTETVHTKERERKGKKTTISADADYSFPISLLSEKEVKELKLPLSEWQQHLEHEQAERARKGVIAFLEKKISVGPLLPDTEDCQLLFEKLARESEAKGRNPPRAFPTLACKQKYTQAAARLNGSLEAAINSALEQGITPIPKIVNYVASPKWQRGEHNGSPSTDERASASSPATRIEDSPKYKRMQANGGVDPKAIENNRRNHMPVL